MSQSKLIDLVNSLTQATEAGKVQWEETPLEEVFRTWIGKNAVRIGDYQALTDEDSPSGKQALRLTVVNASGSLVEDFETIEGPDHEKLERLYTLARRAARRADQVVDEILKVLSR